MSERVSDGREGGIVNETVGTFCIECSRATSGRCWRHSSTAMPTPAMTLTRVQADQISAEVSVLRARLAAWGPVVRAAVAERIAEKRHAAKVLNGESREQEADDLCDSIRERRIAIDALLAAHRGGQP